MQALYYERDSLGADENFENLMNGKWQDSDKDLPNLILVEQLYLIELGQTKRLNSTRHYDN